MGRIINAAVITAAIGTCIATASPATADNASYLAALGDVVQSRTGPDALLAAGKEACRLLRPTDGLMFGRAPHVVAQMLWEAAPNLERDQADFLVATANTHLCPGVNPFAPG